MCARSDVQYWRFRGVRANPSCPLLPVVKRPGAAKSAVGQDQRSCGSPQTQGRNHRLCSPERSFRAVPARGNALPGPQRFGSRARRTGGRVTSQFDLAPFLDQEEGLHFERKSLYHGPRTNRRSRDRREVRDQIAEYVAGFANAEGGVLILGLEDDGEITGHELPRTAVQGLLNSPRAKLDPPHAPGSELRRGDERLLCL